MYHFGRTSRSRLATVHPDLQRVLQRAMDWQLMDFTIVCGHRDERAQNEAYNARPQKSKKKWPESKHNSLPSIAVDVAPWPIDWDDSLAFARLYGIIEAAGAVEGVELRWGGDWDRDTKSNDQSFMDIGHFELV